MSSSMDGRLGRLVQFDERKEAWRDRVSGIPLPELKVVDVRMRKPAWWRPMARRKWRRQLSEAQAGLSDWKPIDPKNPAPEVCSYEPKLVSLCAFTSPDGCSTTVGARYEWDEAPKSPSDQETKKKETK